MEKIALLIVGALLGGIIGFISSYSMWKVQMNQNKANIAQGFYLEISSMENTIEQYAKVFIAPGLGAGPVKIEQPFYSNGLFFDCRKEIFSFYKDLSKTIFEFYTCLLVAERDRQIGKTDKFFVPANDEMKNSIKKAHELLPKLKALLKNEFS